MKKEVNCCVFLIVDILVLKSKHPHIQIYPLLILRTIYGVSGVLFILLVSNLCKCGESMYDRMGKGVFEKVGGGERDKKRKKEREKK